jgi:hypothetical protein
MQRLYPLKGIPAYRTTADHLHIDNLMLAIKQVPSGSAYSRVNRLHDLCPLKLMFQPLIKVLRSTETTDKNNSLQKVSN